VVLHQQTPTPPPPPPPPNQHSYPQKTIIKKKTLFISKFFARNLPSGCRLFFTS